MGCSPPGRKESDTTERLHFPSLHFTSQILNVLSVLIVFLFKFMCVFLAALGLQCCEGFSVGAVSGGHSLVAAHGLLTVVPSRVAEHGCWGVWAR